MAEQTFYLDNQREARQITGDAAERLEAFERVFEVDLVARDAWLRATGPEQAILRFERFLRMLKTARDRGMLIDDQFAHYALDAFRERREHELDELIHSRIDLQDARAPVFPRTFGQHCYVRAIKHNDIAFGIGPAGTGKTYLAIAMAVAELQRQNVSRIILTRPAIEAGETLGFLPGTMHEKIFPYLRPLYDALHDVLTPADIEKKMDRGIIEVAPLAYMRGRTLNHAFVILDEAQNTTEEQMLMFLTRLGFDSKCVVTGDLTQIDLPSQKSSGLLEATRLLARVKGLSITRLTELDVVRHPLVQRIIVAYREGRAIPGDLPAQEPDA